MKLRFIYKVLFIDNQESKQKCYGTLVLKAVLWLSFKWSYFRTLLDWLLKLDYINNTSRKARPKN